MPQFGTYEAFTTSSSLEIKKPGPGLGPWLHCIKEAARISALESSSPQYDLTEESEANFLIFCDLITYLKF